jgi:uncharacterized protein YbgA (DUF1722 family)
MADFEFTITDSDSMVDLEEYINYLIIERCNEIYYKIISQNTEYQNLQAHIKSCFQEILQILPEPAQKEIVTETLLGIIGTLEMLLPRITYKQVLKDGLRLKAWLEYGQKVSNEK